MHTPDYDGLRVRTAPFTNAACVMIGRLVDLPVTRTLTPVACRIGDR
jgi:hypothetical protein